MHHHLPPLHHSYPRSHHAHSHSLPKGLDTQAVNLMALPLHDPLPPQNQAQQVFDDFIEFPRSRNPWKLKCLNTDAVSRPVPSSSSPYHRLHPSSVSSLHRTVFQLGWPSSLSTATGRISGGQLISAVLVSSARIIPGVCLAGKRWAGALYQRRWSSNLRLHFPQDCVESSHHAFCTPTGVLSLGLAWRGVWFGGERCQLRERSTHY